MKINNPFKGLRSGSVLNINRKQKYYKNSITGNHDKQQVGEEGVTSGNAAQNLLLHDWGTVKWLGVGLLAWVDEGAAPQTRVFSTTNVSSPLWVWKVPKVTAATAGPHVSGSCPASGTINTVMSSPEPSLSLGNRQPRSLRTPRDLISRSCAAKVYLCNTQENVTTVGFTSQIQDKVH